MKSALSFLQKKRVLGTVFLAVSILVLFFATLVPVATLAAPAQPTQNTTNNTTTQPQRSNQAGNNSNNQQNSSSNQTQQLEEQSCDDVAGTLSFFLCPIYDQITKLIDWLAGPDNSILTKLLQVPPLQFSQDQGLYKAYTNVLNFANSLFIIVFLVMIFANFISDFSFLDSYTVKSVLPRLIAAIILAQFGYLIVASIIDLGNILGTLGPQLITNGVLGPNAHVPNLTDGTIGLLAIGGNNLLFSAVGGTIVFLLLLLMAIMVVGALLLTLIYMVARYLILVILIFAAPLAFLAWVLPGTQPFFYKWGKNLIQLVLMFPIVMILITTAEVLSFMLLHPTLDPAVFTDDKVKILIGGLIPFVALLLIPKCLKLSGDIMAVTGGAVAGYAVGKSKDGGKKAKESAQNRIAASEKWGQRRVGRVAVAGVGGFSKKSAKATAKMGETRDRAQAVYDKAATLGTSDELKNMLKTRYKPAKVSALVALAKRGDREAVNNALSDKNIGFNKDLLGAATTKDWGAFDGMPDMRNYYDSTAKRSAWFSSMDAKTFGGASTPTKKDWLGNETTNAAGVKVFALDAHKLNSKFSSSQMRNLLSDRNVRNSISEDVRMALAGYGAGGHGAMHQAISSNIAADGSWL